MASDQTLPLLLHHPAPPNPNQIPSPTAPLPDPTPIPTPPPPSSARKLPIKRRSPPRPCSSPSSSGPASSGDPLKQGGQTPPIKFQRIWSESDELRFLQGLLGCGAQGLVFPRDLNVFYDRFSESMPQPYTRSQLSEKLRRLRNKHRSVSTRVAKGLDPARLAPHDRDVLHLCARLWDPANAATSPFTPGAVSSSGNKRRRATPQGVAPLELPAPSGDSNSHGYNGGISSSTTPGAFPDENGEDVMYLEQESGHLYFDEGAPAFVPDGNLDGIALEGITLDQADTMAVLTNVADNGFGDNGVRNDVAPPNAGNNGVDGDNGERKVLLPLSSEHRMARAVLDVFEECLREAKADGTVSGGNAEESQFARRWRAQRIDELDALSRRLRLIIEDATTAGH